MRVALFTDTFLSQINGVTNTLNKLIEYYKSKNIEYLIFAPDIIHIMTEFTMGVAGLIYVKMLGVPTVSNYSTNFPQYLKYYNLNIFQNTSWNYMRWFHNQNDITLCPSTETRISLKMHGIKIQVYFQEEWILKILMKD